MRRLIRRYLPSHSAISGNRWLAPFENSLLHPRLWHLNRRSAAGGIALGMFCGLLPAPFQMLNAAIGAILLRVNLPLAILTTLYTNPFTIVPLYWLGYEIGQWLIGGDGGFFVPPVLTAVSIDGLRIWSSAIAAWSIALGRPLIIGVLVLASLLALSSYGLVRLAWRVHIIHQWRQRQKK
jgi:uncharacterized protein (DUF2062 family)